MPIGQSNQYGPLDQQRLRSLEAKLGVQLPDDYRAVLHEHNGGSPEPGDFVISEDEGEDTVNIFYGLHSDANYALEGNLAAYKLHIPRSMMPIGEDPGGNQLCIGLSGAERGRVYFWDHETLNVIEVAPSFSAFLDSLFDADE